MPEHVPRRAPSFSPAPAAAWVSVSPANIWAARLDTSSPRREHPARRTEPAALHAAQNPGKLRIETLDVADPASVAAWPPPCKAPRWT